MNIFLPCPTCGKRPIQEFIYGEIPTPPEHLSGDALDLDRAFMRTNPEGISTERWFHVYGCRRWLTLKRDTRDNRILE
jgi:heterotetrameric sarcosine oxidase delta subunit